MRSSILTGLLSLSTVANAVATGSLADCLKKVPTSWMSSPDYANLTEPFNLRLVYKPVVVVLPTTNKHIQDAVVCAGKYNVKVQAKSGGHSYASFSSGGKDGSMMIDLQPLQNIKLDTTTNIITVGGGVRLGNLAQGAWDQGKRALSHGTCPGVGIGGHFTHGGYGHTSRNWGLALDHIVGADVILADGSLVHATSTKNTDIFWAIRGAADSFGIVSTFYLRTEAAPEAITYFSFRWADALFQSQKLFTNSFLHIQDFATNATIIDSRISFGIYIEKGVFNLGGTFFGTVEEFTTKIAPELLRTLPTPGTTVTESYTWIDYLILMSDKSDIREPLTGYNEHDTFYAKSITVPEAEKLKAPALAAFYKAYQSATVSYFVIINLYGGPGSAINTKSINDAAYRDRDSLWVFQNYGIGNASIPFINSINKAVITAQPDTDFGAYLNYVDPGYGAEEAHRLYYGEELYQRLLGLKGRFDPKGVFWNPQAIGA